MAARGVISNKIVMEGESEYRAALRAIGSEQKSLQSEMKLVTEAFDGQQNSMQALISKHDILTRQISAANEKLEIYKKRYQEAAEARDKASEKMNEAQKAYEDQKKVVEELAETQGKSSEAYKEAAVKLEELEKELNAATAGYYNAQRTASDFAAKQNDAERAVVKLNHELTDNEKHLDEARASADGCATSIDKFGKEVKEAEEDSEKLGDGLKKADEALNTISAILVSSGIAQGFSRIRDAMGECIEVANKFEYSINKVQTVALYSGAELDDMAKRMKGYSLELGVSASNLADGAYQAITAGVDASKAVDFSAEATKLAIAGFSDASTVIDAVTTALNAYEMEADQATHIMDNLITTQNQGKTSVAELASGLGRVIPTASAFGLSFDNVTTAITEMTAKSVPTRQALSYLTTMLTEMGDGGKTVAKTLMEHTGKSFTELMESGKSLGDVLTVLYNSVDKDNTAFINLWGSSKVGVAALKLCEDTGDRFNEILMEMENNVGATDRAFQLMADTSEMVEARFQTAMENFKISVGDALSPVVDRFKEMGVSALEALTKFCEECPAVVQTLAGLVMAVTGVVTVIGVAKAAMLAFNTVMASTPAGMVITGIAGVVGALSALCDALTDSDEELKKLSDDFQARDEAFKKSSDSFKTNTEEAKKLKETIERLQNKVDNYGKAVALTTAEKMEMANAVARLNELYPELGLQIDETTGKLVNYTEAMAESLDVAVKQYELKQNQEEYNALIEKAAADTKALAEAQEKWKAATEGMSEGEIYYEAKVLHGELGDLSDLIEDDLIPATEKNEEAFKELTDRGKELESELNSMGESSGSAADGLNGTADAVDEAANRISESTKKIVESLVSSIESVDPLFEHLSGTAEHTMGEMSSNLEKNAEVIEKWGKFVTSATHDTRYATDENFRGMVDMIVQKGPQAAGELENFVRAAKSNSDEFQNLMSNYKLYSEALSESMQVVSDYGTSVENAGAVAISKRESFNSEMLGKQKEGQSNMEESAKTHKETMTTTTTETPQAMADGINENAGLVTEACEKMLEEAQKVVEDKMSHDTWFGYGKKAMESLASGITKGSSAVSTAIKTCVQAAIDNADISGLAKKIDKALGASMTK